MAVSCSAMVMADDKTPSVYVDSAEIMFADQAPVILGEGTTLVPARGVFEAMGATVEWDGETRVVKVTSDDNNTVVKLTIDDSTMKVYDMSGMIGTLMSGQDFVAPETPVTLAVAPQIINDRTMIPLRAISEALKSEVNWDGDAYRIDIKTGTAPATTEALPSFSISASASKVAAGETVDVYINAKNVPADTFVSGVTATVKYDAANYEFVSAALVNGDAVIEGATGATSTDIGANMVKAVFVTIDAENAAKADGTVMKFTFKALNDNESTFALSDSYHTLIGYNTFITTQGMPVDGVYPSGVEYMGNDFFVDTTEVVVNSADAVEEVTADDTTEAVEEKTDDATEAEADTTETTEEVTADETAEATEDVTAETAETTDEAATSDSAVAE